MTEKPRKETNQPSRRPPRQSDPALITYIERDREPKPAEIGLLFIDRPTTKRTGDDLRGGRVKRTALRWRVRKSRDHSAQPVNLDQ